jgi:hypothetical protein
VLIKGVIPGSSANRDSAARDSPRVQAKTFSPYSANLQRVHVVFQIAVHEGEMRHFLRTSLLFLFLGVSIAEGQTPGTLTGNVQDAKRAIAGQQQPVQSDAEGPRIAKATRVDHAPRLDGTLDDPLWLQATPISDFKQREPYEGQLATEPTEVRILYSRNEIYFGITCHDAAANGPVATQLRRDVTQELDDYFEIVIDSRHDGRNAYVFQINPLGTQRDALITDEQAGDTQDGDTGWDGVWASEARVTKDGWTATVAIPFSTLNFMRSRDVVWGLNLKRFIRRKNEEDLWSAWPRTFGAAKISQAGELHGISDIGSGRLFVVKPYALGGFNHLPANATASGLTPGTNAVDTGGVDIKVGLRSNLVANLTGNTDFADSDVDVQQFNLTPYKLFFPEKRQFFLENEGVFDFPMGLSSSDQLFFSRQIGIDPVTGQQVPINGGAKITGSLGGFELGLMDVDTRSSGPNPWANYAVVRVKKSLWGSGSYIGAMGIDKRSGEVGSSFNQTFGLDGRFVLFKNLILSGYAAQTRTPGFSGGQTNLGASLIYHSNWLELQAEHRKVGPNFNPAVGFLERADCICDYVDAEFKLRPKFAGLRELQFEGFLSHDPDTHHVVQTQEWLNTFRAEFQNGSYTDDDIVDVFAQRLTTPFNIYKNVNIPVGIYTWTRHQLTYGTAQNRHLTAQFFERFGSYYNGRLNELSVRGSYRPSARLSFSLGPQWNRFQLPTPERNFSVVFGAVEADYAFSRFLSLSTILQVDTANTQAVSANIRLRWNYRPDSDLYVIYTAGQQFASLAAATPAQFYQNRFVVKYTYSFRP